MDPLDHEPCHSLTAYPHYLPSDAGSGKSALRLCEHGCSRRGLTPPVFHLQTVPRLPSQTRSPAFLCCAEVRTPASTIAGVVELMQCDTCRAEDLESNLQLIEQASSQILRLARSH